MGHFVVKTIFLWYDNICRLICNHYVRRCVEMAVFSIINLILLLLYVLAIGVGVYVLYLIIKALKIYIKKNS